MASQSSQFVHSVFNKKAYLKNKVKSNQERHEPLASLTPDTGIYTRTHKYTHKKKIQGHYKDDLKPGAKQIPPSHSMKPQRL